MTLLLMVSRDRLCVTGLEQMSKDFARTNYFTENFLEKQEHEHQFL